MNNTMSDKKQIRRILKRLAKGIKNGEYDPQELSESFEMVEVPVDWIMRKKYSGIVTLTFKYYDSSLIQLQNDQAELRKRLDEITDVEDAKESLFFGDWSQFDCGRD